MQFQPSGKVVAHCPELHLVSNKENIDTGTPGGKLMLSMVGAINDFIAITLFERLRELTPWTSSRGSKKAAKK